MFVGKPFKLALFGKQYEYVLTGHNRYANGRRVVTLVDNTNGEPFAVLTVNLPDVPLADDEILVKTWTENEAIAPAVLAAFPEDFEDTGVD